MPVPHITSSSGGMLWQLGCVLPVGGCMRCSICHVLGPGCLLRADVDCRLTL